MKTFYRIGADIFFLIHGALFLIILLGPFIEALWPFYMALLVAVLISDLVFGYCLLSKP